jgi:hypothetical protein
MRPSPSQMKQEPAIRLRYFRWGFIPVAYVSCSVEGAVFLVLLVAAPEQEHQQQDDPFVRVRVM